MASLLRIASGLALATSLLASCGDDDTTSSSADPAPSSTGPSSTAPPADDADPSEADPGDAADPGDEAPVVVVLDGERFAMTTVQACRTEYDPNTDTDIQASGLTSSGQRLEIGFSRQGDQYLARIGIGAGARAVGTVSDEPFALLDGDRATVEGTVELEDRDTGDAVQVDLAITCP